MSDLKLSDRVRREIELLPVPFQYTRTKNHWFLRVEGFRPVLVAGSHGSNKTTKGRNEKMSACAVKRIREALETSK